MEYVGSQVRKVVQGSVTLFGFVQAYLPSTCFYKIMYNNGDSEELSFPKMSSLLVSLQPPCQKRCRLNNRGTDGGVYLNNGGNVPRFDLNEVINRVLNKVIGEGSSRVLGIGPFNLNVDFSQGFENVGGEREIRNFDLNVKLTEDEQVGDFDDHLSSPILCVYVFLRSFSTLMFLSPFELDDFLACILCTDSTLLFDFIHVYLLRTLTIHLKSLANGGFKSAYVCLSVSYEVCEIR